jgi:hypothetical protein
MKGSVFCHHPFVCLSDENAMHDVLVVALILTRLDQWRGAKNCASSAD